MTTQPAGHPWVRATPGARSRLICLPFAGAGSAPFAPWRAALPGVEVCPVVLPGRETRLREPPATDLGELARRVADGLDPLLDTPWWLAGYSMGTALAHALCLELRRRRRPLPRALLVMARRAPHLPDPHPPLGGLPDDAFLAALQARYEALPAAVLAEPELVRLFLPPLKADVAMLDRWTPPPEAPIDLPITAWYGAHDPTTRRDQVLAWQDLTTAPVAIHEVQARHFFHQDPALLSALARSLR